MYKFSSNNAQANVDYLGLDASSGPDSDDNADGCCGVWQCSFGCAMSLADVDGKAIPGLADVRVEGFGEDKDLSVAKDLARQAGAEYCADAVKLFLLDRGSFSMKLMGVPVYDKEPDCICVEDVFGGGPKVKTKDAPKSAPPPAVRPIPQFSPPKLDDPFEKPRPRPEPPNKLIEPQIPAPEIGT